MHVCLGKEDLRAFTDFKPEIERVSPYVVRNLGVQKRKKLSSEPVLLMVSFWMRASVWFSMRFVGLTEQKGMV